jgi:UDP-N-acetylmuramate dehydrogenase
MRARNGRWGRESGSGRSRSVGCLQTGKKFAGCLRNRRGRRASGAPRAASGSRRGPGGGGSGRVGRSPGGPWESACFLGGGVTGMALSLPPVRGALTRGRPMADLTWLRVGGPADWLFQPADEADLADFLAALPPEVPVLPVGVGSNLIVRDGGIEGVVIRLGRGFGEIGIAEGRVVAGAAALDARVARRAAEAGLDLTFLRTIPGSIGGAVRMNAGCYGQSVADVLVEARAVLRDGRRVVLEAGDLGFGYRTSSLPQGAVITQAVFAPPDGLPQDLAARMEAQVARRDASQPVRERSAGSTFRNPSGASSTGRPDDAHDLKAWKLIEDAGLRGATLGRAQLSEKHANFLINRGGATAAELEGLGEMVRKKVLKSSGIQLEWEIMRIGRT